MSDSVQPPAKPAPFPKARFLEFCRKLKVNSKDFGKIPFELLGTQLYVLDCICAGLDQGITTFMILKARQLGMTTFFIALDLFWAFEYPGLLGALATHTEQSRDQFRSIIRLFLNGLPKAYKHDAQVENRMMVTFSNDASFTYLVAGTKVKEKGSIGRGGAFNFLHATEVAFWGSEDDLAELRTTMSTHYQHRLQIYETTANGYNHFCDSWYGAKESPTQMAIFVGWWLHDHYRFARDHPYFDAYCPDGDRTTLSKRERDGIAQVRERYGVEVTLEQVAWYRWKLDEEVKDPAKMDELFPWVEEDAFVATGSKFFTNDSLTPAMRRARQLPYQAWRYHTTDLWHETDVRPGSRERHDLKIFEEAKPEGVYAIGCDPAYGSSDSADRTVVTVLRCFSDRVVQVAEYVSSVTKTYQCAWVVAHLAGYYRNCMVNLEINGPGLAVDQALSDLRREMAHWHDDNTPGLKNILGSFRTYLYANKNSITGGQLARHWKNGPATKPFLMNAYKDNFELNRVIVNSAACLEEMKIIVIEGAEIRAEGNKKDDRVMGIALASMAWQQWLRPRLAAEGKTFLRETDPNRHTSAAQVRNMISGYLSRMNITVPTQ